MKTKGFTLVELLVVIAILAILATVSVVGYTSYIQNANETALTTDAENLESIIEADLILGNQYVKIGTTGDANTPVYVARVKGVVGIYTATETTANNVTTVTLADAAMTSGTITLGGGQFEQFKAYTVTVTAANKLSIQSDKVETPVVITLD